MKNCMPLLVAVVLLSGCKKALKDPNEYYPTVKTVKAEVLPNGSVLVEGEIVAEGESPIQHVGFCCKASSNPSVMDGQIIATLSGNHFSATYFGLQPDSTYYFKAWAANEIGYALGESIVLDSVIGVPQNPPCNLPAQFADIGTIGSHQIYMVGAPQQGNGDWMFQASSGTGLTLNFRFGSALTTGIYTTSGTSNPGNGQVQIDFIENSISGTLLSGHNVYVTQINPNLHEITICDAPWNYNSSTIYFDARLETPY